MELSVRDLIVASRSGEVLLDIPRIDAKPGTAIGIRGASGAGKSTLLRALMGLTAYTKGDVIWGATRLLSVSARRKAAFRRDQMGIVFQDFLLFDELGAAENAAIQAAFSPRRTRANLARSAADLLRQLSVETHRRSVASLSGGERQRVAVARALAHDPTIVLADEPTASLDQTTGETLATELLDRVRERGVTLVVASHDERLLERMDRILLLDHGRAVEAYV